MGATKRDYMDLIEKPTKKYYIGHNNFYVITRNNRSVIYADAELEFGGEKISCNITIMPLTGGENESLGMLLMIEDISSEKRMKALMTSLKITDAEDSEGTDEN